MTYAGEKSSDTAADTENEFAKRLDKFNIEYSSIEWFDLVLEPGLGLDLKKGDPQLGRLVQKVPMQSFEQLRNCLGVPPGAKLVSEKKLPFVPKHFLLDKNQRDYNEHDAKLAETAGRYLLGDEIEISSEFQKELNSWVSHRVTEIFPAFLRDVYVARDAQLLVDIDVLFARYITIERRGRIVIPPNRHVTIDCRGVKSTLATLTTEVTSNKGYLHKVS